MTGWRVERATGSAAAFHARPLGGPGRAERVVRVHEVDRPALVLGSTQPEADVDIGAVRAAGVELVRRRSGGGAVLLDPGASLWVDVDLPAGDPLWRADVGEAFLWLGQAWATAFTDLGMVAAVHRGPLVTTRWSRLVCFAGLGSGEVTVGGRKVVGLAQRRTREAVRFQCAMLRRWDPERLLDLLAGGGALAGAGAGKREAVADLRAVASGVDRPVGRVFGALLAALPD